MKLPKDDRAICDFSVEFRYSSEAVNEQKATIFILCLIVYFSRNPYNYRNQ
jgi:hypothetical protein